jgi:hypothetical protein
MSVEVASQEASRATRKDSRLRWVAMAYPVDPRPQSEKASRRITVMRRLVRPANPRLIIVAIPSLASCLVPSTFTAGEQTMT